jgi:hypothetical protein
VDPQSPVPAVVSIVSSRLAAAGSGLLGQPVGTPGQHPADGLVAMLSSQIDRRVLDELSHWPADPGRQQALSWALSDREARDPAFGDTLRAWVGAVQAAPPAPGGTAPVSGSPTSGYSGAAPGGYGAPPPGYPGAPTAGGSKRGLIIGLVVGAVVLLLCLPIGGFGLYKLLDRSNALSPAVGTWDDSDSEVVVSSNGKVTMSGLDDESSCQGTIKKVAGDRNFEITVKGDTCTPTSQSGLTLTLQVSVNSADTIMTVTYQGSSGTLHKVK